MKKFPSGPLVTRWAANTRRTGHDENRKRVSTFRGGSKVEKILILNEEVTEQRNMRITLLCPQKIIHGTETARVFKTIK